MMFIALLLGGVIGAAQLTVMWGLASSLIVGPSLMNAVGWLLLYRFLAFVVEYSFAWVAMFLMFRFKYREW